MISSSSFEFALVVDGQELVRATRDGLQVPGDPDFSFEIAAESRVSVLVGRGNRSGRVRLRLGGETMHQLGEGVAELRTPPEAWFLHDFGESLLVVEHEGEAREDSFGGRSFVPVFRILFRVRARAEVERDYRVMLEDMGRIHVALASDLLGRTHITRGLGAPGARPLHAPELVQELEEVERRLASALDRIGRQPSSALTREYREGRWRPGDPAGHRIAGALAQAGIVPSGAGGRASTGTLPRLRVHRPASTTDIPEHRHLAEGLRALQRRAARIAERCRAAASSYRAAESRWGRRAGRERSVYEKRDLPRAQVMDELAMRSERLAAAFRRLLDRSAFLAHAGPPRTPFGPTPLFLNRPAYREAYEALRQMSGRLGLLVETGPVPVSLRSLATLFEYWCFLRVVEGCRRRFGPPLGRADGVPLAEVYDDIYRPDLRPGQRIEFDGGRLGCVAVLYEPDFLPVREARGARAAYAASLTGAPLRPDVAIEVSRGGSRSLLLLDAKSTSEFTMEHLRAVVDYLIQIHETGTGRQPARQLFLLHRDPTARVTCSLPGYLSGRVPGAEALIKGAIPVLPTHVGADLPELENVLERFFETALMR